MGDRNHFERSSDLVVDDQEGKAAHDIAARTVQVAPPPAWTLGDSNDRPIELSEKRRSGSFAAG